MQSLLEELPEVEQQCGIVDDQGGPGISGCLLGGQILLLCERDDRDMGGAAVLSEA